MARCCKCGKAESTMICLCGDCAKKSEDETSLIYKWLEKFFDTPCNIGDEDEFMLHNCMDWCDENCGRLNDLDNHSECWKKYFELKGKEELK